MVHDESFQIRKTDRLQLLDRSSLYALSLEDFARLVLQVDRKDNKVDDLTEDWALGVPPTPVEAGYLGGFIEDEQSRFNLNSLINSEEAVKRFTRLCNNLEVDPVFIPALLDWLDEDLDVRYPEGAEDGYDTYRVANRIMSDTSELLLVKNVDHEMYGKLKPFITALPTTTSNININTISETVYLSLHEELDAEAFVQEREDEPFASVADFIARMQIPFVEEGLSVNSEYFRAYGQVVQGDLEYNFQSLIFRNDQGATQVVNRTLGFF
jgi:general secretion pathway protein K